MSSCFTTLFIIATMLQYVSKNFNTPWKIKLIQKLQINMVSSTNNTMDPVRSRDRARGKTI